MKLLLQGEQCGEVVWGGLGQVIRVTALQRTCRERESTCTGRGRASPPLQALLCLLLMCLQGANCVCWGWGACGSGGCRGPQQPC